MPTVPGAWRKNGGRTLAIGLAAAALAAIVAVAEAPATKLLGGQHQLTSHSSGFGSFGGQLAYNSKKRQYLVVYTRTVGGGDTEIFGHRLDDEGEPIGGSTQLSDTPGAGRNAREPVVAYSRKTNSYYVAFQAERLPSDDELEVYGQRVGSDGGRAGSAIRLSQIGADGDPGRTLLAGPSITYNDDEDQYLVVWSADDVADDEFEIQAQRVGATGNAIGPEIPVSSTPGANRDATDPDVAYNPRSKQFLVVWHDDGFGAPNETDVFGQLLNAGGGQVGTNDLRISQTGADGGNDELGRQPSVAANTHTGEYLVAFAASRVPSNELEIKIQRLTRGGAQTGANDQQITQVGPAGDDDFNAGFPEVAFSEPARQYMVAYAGEDLGTDDEFEAFAQRISSKGEQRGADDLRVSQLAPDGNQAFGLGIGAFDQIGLVANGQLSEWIAGYWGDASGADDTFNVFTRRIGLRGKCAGKRARVGGPGRDVIRLGKGRDVIAAKGGRDNVKGKGGRDRLCGGKGKDRLAGAKGKDRLIGGKGKDRCLGGKGRDRSKGCESGEA